MIDVPEMKKKSRIRGTVVQLKGGRSGDLRPGLTDNLISTKLNMPPLKKKMVERKHLLDRLSEGREAPLIVISGVAGSGKTCLVCQWAARDSLRLALYSLEEGDNDIHLFFRYLFAGLSGVVQLLALTGPSLPAGSGLRGRDAVAQLIECLTNLQEDTYLVLDDYQQITSPEIHEVVNYFLDHMPKRMHVVITSRTAVPFSLTQFKVRDQVVEISPLDMRFTEEETELFFRDVIPLTLSTDSLRDIESEMEGWVGGLQLFGVSLRGKQIPEDVSSVLARISREAADYIIKEVVNVQPEDVKTLLCATSLLDRFNSEVAADVSGIKDAAGVLDRIYRSNLFLTPLDDGHIWYRYHHIFSAVRDQMKLSMPDLSVMVYKQAALWFARHGYLEDAFHNAFASEDLEFAADLMEDYMLQINDRYEYASGSRWLAKLPDHIFKSRVLLRLHDCGQKIECFRLADIEAVLGDIERDREHAFDRYDGHKKTYCEDVFTYFRHVLPYYYRDPSHPAPEQLEKAFAMISPENGLFAGYLKTVIAWSHISRGCPLEAEAALDEALPLIISSGKLWARVLWFRLSATVQRIRGRLRTSEAILQEAFRFLEERKLSETPLRYVLYIPMAWVHYFRNNIEKAAELAASATAYGEHVGFVRDIAEGNLLLSLTRLAAGELKEAEDCLRKVRLLAEKQGVVNFGFSAEPWIVHLSMAEEELRYATEWSGCRKLSMDEPFSSRFVRDCLTQAELLLNQRHYRKANSVLVKLRRLCTDHRMMEAVLDIDIARSAALYGMGHYDKARQVMADALLFGEAEGYIQPFLNYAPLIFPLLSDMKGKDPGFRQFLHLKTVMAAFAIDHKGLVGSTPRLRKDRSKGLTEREVEILKLMAAGNRYREIAQRMFVSVETVKTHIKHIFKKLEVTSKTQAVRRAQDLRLLTG
jgi:LuxR family maltose regulon positive regulatory protein